MKKHKILLAAAFAAVVQFTTGCQTIVNPNEQPTTDRDNAIYEAGKRATERKDEVRYTVEVYVEAPSGQSHLETTTYDYLRSKLGKFPFFKVVTSDAMRNRMLARRQADAARTGEEESEPPRSEAQYVILVKIDLASQDNDGGMIGKLGDVVLGNSVPSVRLNEDMSISFEFYDNVKEDTISLENLVRKVSGSNYIDVSRECIDEFITILSRDYLQEARVLKTSGNASFAWISLGRKDGIKPGMKVRFCEIVDVGDVMDSWSATYDTIAYGEVIGIPDDRTSWVQIQNPDKVWVKKYHFVKVLAN